MPRISTTVHDPVALAATCRQLGLPPPVERAARLAGEAVFGWVLRLPGVRSAVVCDTLTGLIAYHPCDNAHDRFAQVMCFVYRYYDVRAELRRDGDRAAARNGRRSVPATEAV